MEVRATQGPEYGWTRRRWGASATSPVCVVDGRRGGIRGEVARRGGIRGEVARAGKGRERGRGS